MDLTSDARLALVGLIWVLGAVGLARWEARLHPPRVMAAPRPGGAEPPEHTGEGARLRDGRPIDPNAASTEELELLPGVGPSLARRIASARAKQRFERPSDLLRVKGVGPKLLKKLEPYLRFSSK